MARYLVNKFQSTRPVRGETLNQYDFENYDVISIHSPRAGRDAPVLKIPLFSQNFNPLAPCGARQYFGLSFYDACKFQSTRPVRGETSCFVKLLVFLRFQSTRPVRGETFVAVTAPEEVTLFQSTRPVRGETQTPHALPAEQKYFNPLAPCGARQRVEWFKPADWKISIHSPRAGRDRYLEGGEQDA